MLAGETFRTLVDKYMRKALHKGVPPLFVDLRPLYKSPERVEYLRILLLLFFFIVKIPLGQIPRAHKENLKVWDLIIPLFVL